MTTRRVVLYCNSFSPRLALLLKNPKLHIHGVDQMKHMFFQAAFPECVLAPGVALNIKEVTIPSPKTGEPVNVVYADNVGENPASDFLEKNGLPRNIFPLRPGDPQSHFCLRGMGLMGYISGDADETFFDAAREVVNKHTPTNDDWRNALTITPNELKKIIEADEGDEQDYFVNQPATQNPNIIFTNDIGMELAAFEASKEGKAFTLYYMTGNEAGDEFKGYASSNELTTTYMPWISTTEATAPDHLLPICEDNQFLFDRAMSFYSNGLPPMFDWLTTVVPLDIVTLWQLPVGQPFKVRVMQAHPDLGPNEFNDVLTVEVVERLDEERLEDGEVKLPERALVGKSLTGEEVRFEDIVFSGPAVAPVALEGDMRQRAMDEFGAQPVDFMAIKNGLL